MREGLGWWMIGKGVSLYCGAINSWIYSNAHCSVFSLVDSDRS